MKDMSVVEVKNDDDKNDENDRKHVRITDQSAINGRKTADQYDPKEIESMLPEELDNLFNTMPLTKETTCGYWIFKGWLLQKCANKKVYVFLYGVVGCLLGATYAYFNATITTLEKRYKIPSRNTGIISVGNDIAQLFVSSVLSYYAGKGHRPRWMSFGLLTIVIFCVMNAFPHLLYGPGEDALHLTLEHGGVFDSNTTFEVMEEQKRKTLCRLNSKGGAECELGEANFAPQVVLFLAQIISGIGQPLYYTLGTSYMDDNIKKSKTATFISLSYFLRMLGPAMGYSLASYCLQLYIAPSLTPTITNLDPRWLGAWWLGWIVLGICMLFAAILLAMFPKSLPRAAVRRVIHKERIRRNLSVLQAEPEKASLKDMLVTFKRLLKNATLTFNNVSSIFYFFGYLPFWTFTPKYIETQYRQSASVSSLVTGTVALAFSALGILLSGVVISRFKPSARCMAAWNVFVGVVSVIGVLSYTLLGCPDNERSVVINYATDVGPSTCNSNCHCDYVKYSPVCGEDGSTYISACHAGCTDQIKRNNQKIFTQCSCIHPNSTGDQEQKHFDFLSGSFEFDNTTQYLDNETDYGTVAKPGSCPVNCFKQFVTFLAVMCLMKFVGSTGRATNFLVSVRCVEEKDKTVAMGFGLMMLSLFAFIPSPIFFGNLMDRNCLVWGKTCSGTGNCWLYNGETLRWSMNTIAAAFIAVGALFDVGVWYHVKDLKIFDDDVKETELKELHPRAAADANETKDGGNDEKRTAVTEPLM